MKRSKKTPAPKTTKPFPKKAAATKEATPKDASTPAKAATPPSREPKPRDARLPAPGASLDREFKGKTYHLKFLDEGGVEVGGKVFGSLSAAARHVTGAASINGFLWAGLLARDGKTATKDAETPKGGKAAKAKAPTAPKIGGETNDFATPAGQRAALAAAGLAKKAKGTKAAATEGGAK